VTEPSQPEFAFHEDDLILPPSFLLRLADALDRQT
jgi:hypothetical protein